MNGLHCWQDYADFHGFGSDEWADAKVNGGRTCMLPDGHDGPHKWTPDESITVTFEAVEQLREEVRR